MAHVNGCIFVRRFKKIIALPDFMDYKRMDKKNNSLRAAAVKQLQHASTTNSETHSAEKLLHELQVHQIELEMQNENLRQSNEALAESRRDYLELYEFAPVGYLTLSQQGLIEKINLTGATLLGKKFPQLLQRRFAGFVNATDADRWHLFFAQVMRGNEQKTLEVSLKQPNDNWLHVQLHCLPMLKADKQPTLWIALTNITESKQVAAELVIAANIELTFQNNRAAELSIANKEVLIAKNQLQIIIDLMPIAIFAKDSQHRIILMNKACEAQWGLSFAQVKNTTGSQFFPPEQMTDFLAVDKQVFADGKLHESEEFVWNSALQANRVHHSYKQVVLNESGQPLYLIGVSEDITERKKIEETHIFLSECVHKYPEDETFFEALARYLANCLGMNFVCIDCLIGDGLNAETLAVYHNGQFEDNVVYALKDTPCGDVEGKTICCFPASVCQYFPKDEVLQTLHAESYVGTTLWSSTGQAIGLIAVISEKPLINRTLAEAVLKIVALRAASELERRQVLQKLRESEQRYRTLANSGQALVWISGTDKLCHYFNKVWLDFTGRSLEQELGNGWSEGVYPDDLQHCLEVYNKAFEMQQNFSMEYRLHRHDGEYRWLLDEGTPRYDSNGNFIGYIGHCLDITERKAAEEEIKLLAFYDPLTGLPNRRKLLDRLRYAIAINRRNHSQFAVFMMDLDKFKAVNDKLGHAAGDELLKQVAARITRCLRDSDMVVRLGGDEFVLVLENMKIPKAADIIALKVIAELTVPFQLSANDTVQIGASIGISLYPQHGNTPESLMDHADTALYQAKDNGRGCFTYFSVMS